MKLPLYKLNLRKYHMYNFLLISSLLLSNLTLYFTIFSFKITQFPAIFSSSKPTKLRIREDVSSLLWQHSIQPHTPCFLEFYKLKTPPNKPCVVSKIEGQNNPKNPSLSPLFLAEFRRPKNPYKRLVFLRERSVSSWFHF